VSDEGSDAFSDDVARVLCESRDRAAPSMGEVCAEVCLAVLTILPSSFFTIAKIPFRAETLCAALMAVTA
jgi:hypothetical protein